jgi:hypothetical protein
MAKSKRRFPYPKVDTTVDFVETTPNVFGSTIQVEWSSDHHINIAFEKAGIAFGGGQWTTIMNGTELDELITVLTYYRETHRG